jgi:hypothetical protein
MIILQLLRPAFPDLFGGQLMVGLILSATVTVKLQVEVNLLLFVAV